MARRSNQKLKLLYLSRILLEQTDSERGITLSQIISELNRYGIQCGRKCLYDDIEALRVFGINVQTKRDRYVRYYVASKKLAETEQRILSDLIVSCEYIGEKKATELLKILSELGGVQLLLPDTVEQLNKKIKPPNDELYKNIELIIKAIASDKKITFKYFEWNSQKQRKLLYGGEYIRLSPLKLDLNNARYVLVAFDSEKNSVIYMYPDRMLNMSVLKQPRNGKEMLDGENDIGREYANVRIKCSNTLAGEVLEHFGLDITILANREEWFEFSTKTEINDSFFSWLFLHGADVKLVSPESAVNKLKEMCNKIMDI